MLQVNGFEAIDIQDATNLELQVGSGSEIDHSRHPEMIQKPEIGLRQAWINSLQNAKGPNRSL